MSDFKKSRFKVSKFKTLVVDSRNRFVQKSSPSSGVYVQEGTIAAGQAGGSIAGCFRRRSTNLCNPHRARASSCP